MPAYEYEHREGIVALDDVGLHYLEWGEAETGTDVLIIHGIMSMGVRWNLFACSLMDDFHVVAPDLRGHGHSARADSYQIEDYANDMEQLIDRLGLESPAVVGHSLGGAIAMRLLGSRDLPLAKLVIVDMSAELPAARLRDVLDEWRDVRREWDDYEGVVENVAATRLPHPENEDAREYVFNHFEWTADGALRERFDTDIFNFDRWVLWEEVRRIQTPTLLLRGEHSETLTREAAVRMMDEMPNLRLVEMPGTYHSLQVEDPENFNRIAGDFLRG